MHKLWIDPEGNLIPIQDSHEGYANSKGHELETLLEQSWVRAKSPLPTSFSTSEFV
jgi:hypothetical protein